MTTRELMTECEINLSYVEVAKKPLFGRSAVRSAMHHGAGHHGAAQFLHQALNKLMKCMGEDATSSRNGGEDAAPVRRYRYVAPNRSRGGEDAGNNRGED